MAEKSSNVGTKPLSLMEEVVLLCLRPEGSFSASLLGAKCPSVGIVGGIILELVLLERVKLTSDNNKTLFVLSGEGLTGDDLLDDAILIMAKEDSKDCSIDYWVKCLNGTLITHKGIPKMQERVMERLMKKDILSYKHQKVLADKYPFSIDNPDIQKYVSKVRGNCLGDPQEIGAKADIRSYCLLGLIQACDKPFIHTIGNAIDLDRIFPRKTERELMRKNLEILLSEESESTEATVVSKKISSNIVRRMIRICTLGIFATLFNI